MMKKVLVFGSNGGIASAFIDHSKSKGLAVVGVSRQECDLTSEKSIFNFLSEIKKKGPFDTILVGAGVLHTDTVSPEKNIKQVCTKNLQTTFEVNAFGPILLLKACLELFDKKEDSIFAVISARVGSISDNRLGGWYSYRASKAALNMLLKTASIELSRTHPKLIIAGLHPGTVDTKLSEPFQARVPASKLFTANDAAKKLFTVMQSLSQEDSGYCFAWDGQKIPF